MVKLGSKVTDRLTGFTVIVMGPTEYLYRCTSIGVLPQELKDGRTQEWVWVDEQRLDEESEATTGGPQPVAPSR